MTEPQQVTEKEARAVAEAAREDTWDHPSFAKDMFLGRLDPSLLDSGWSMDAATAVRARLFLSDLERVLRNDVDAERIDRDDKVPESSIAALRKIGAFGIKIPVEYGGLGLPQVVYNEAVALAGVHSAAIGALLSAHQSIGVPQPLKLFGTAEQKKQYLPRLAAGAISAFALTEADVGSDPARMSAWAEPTDDGKAFTLNGEKLWCTNGPIAELLVVMAKTPPVREGQKHSISAFIVETAWAGVEVAHRCAFMGLRGMENGVIRFTNVRVPRENVIWGVGKGLKLALTTLNTGRLTLPAMAGASGRLALRLTREWASKRTQWGRPIGQHEAIGQKIAQIAANTFAMDAIALYCAELADSGKSDIRLEAALAKMWNSEMAWKCGDEALQILGGRGYETNESLAARGEEPRSIERGLRDLRINRIFEGSTEILHLFIAREALDEHLRAAAALLDEKASFRAKVAAFGGATAHFARWLPGLLLPRRTGVSGPLGRHARFAERSTRRLARNLFYSMVRFGPKLEKKQGVLFRLVDIGAEIFAMTCTIKRAERLASADARMTADLFCRLAARRVDRLFEDVWSNEDAPQRKVSEKVLGGALAWIEQSTANPEAI